jgi:hypothetical protein
MRFLSSALVGLVTLVLAAPAWAQTPAPPAPTPAAAPARAVPDNRIPVFAADARGMFASLGEDTLTSASLYVPTGQMKSKAFGVQLGAHVYPWRGKAMALGVGGEAALVSNSFETVDTTTLKPTGTIYNRNLEAYSVNVSLNFGKKNGWSYLTAGYGPVTFASYLSTLTRDDISDKGLNYGAGARWFKYDHLAFTVDLRFYATPPANATLNTAPRLRNTVFVMSAGVSIK